MLRILDVQPELLSNWRPQSIDMPLEHVVKCFCCGGNELVPLVGIYCGKPVASSVVVVSACRGCGWLGYVTRPSEAWFDFFYAQDWDAAGQGATVDLSKCDPHPITKFVPQVVKPPATVCDMGCGFGEAAWQLRKLGYKAFGVEKSWHRSGVALDQGVAVGSCLKDFERNFDVITAHHVLEHAYDPNTFIAEIATHQTEGGILYLSVPNQRGEPAMGCLLFLPHLHSFTVQSLCKLAARHGYGLDRGSVTGFNLELAFVKGAPEVNLAWGAAHHPVAKLSRAIHANGQGPYLNWCGNLSDARFVTEDRLAGRFKDQWNPRAIRAERARGSGRFPLEVETPCLFVK